jgi:hypothetical protein
MLNRAAVPLLGLIVVLAGCASSESAMIATLPTVDVSGTWTGGPARGAATYTLVLEQTGSNVKGCSAEPGPRTAPSKALWNATPSGCGKQAATDPLPR